MSGKFHVNEYGNPGRCNATVQCPFGDLDADHYTTMQAAREAYEAKQGTLFPVPSSRTERPRPVAVRDELVRKIEQHKDIIERTKNQMTHEEAAARAQTGGYLDEMTVIRLGVLSNVILSHETALKKDEEELKELKDVKSPAEDPSVSNPSPRMTVQSVLSVINENGSSNKCVMISLGENDSVLLTYVNRDELLKSNITKPLGDKGWVVETVNSETIRIVDPSRHNLPIIGRNQFDWSSDSQSFFAEASDLKDFPDSGFTFMKKNDPVHGVRLVPSEQVMDDEGDVLYWVYKPENLSMKWTVRLFND